MFKKGYHPSVIIGLSLMKIILASNDVLKYNDNQSEIVRSTVPMFSNLTSIEPFQLQPQGICENHPARIAIEMQQTSRHFLWKPRYPISSKATLKADLNFLQRYLFMTAQYQEIISILKCFGVVQDFTGQPAIQRAIRTPYISHDFVKFTVVGYSADLIRVATELSFPEVLDDRESFPDDSTIKITVVTVREWAKYSISTLSVFEKYFVRKNESVAANHFCRSQPLTIEALLKM